MEISKEQIAKMAESYKKAETQHVAQRAVTKNGILESAESVEVLKRMSPKSFAFSIDVDDQAVATACSRNQAARSSLLKNAR